MRQRRVREQLSARDLDAALLADDGHVHAMTGYWARSVLRRVVLIERDGRTTLVVDEGEEGVYTADEVVRFAARRRSTLVEDQLGAAVAALGDRLKPTMRLGCDQGVRVCLPGVRCARDFYPAMLAVRRCKDADEVALLRRAIAATEAAFDWLRRALIVGADEMRLFAGVLAAAAEHAGEIIGEIGNDFQIGPSGSAPTRRAAQRGEIAIFDLTVVLRGYHSDLSRSMVVGGEPTDAQQQAHERVVQVLEEIERDAKAGDRCRAIDRMAREMLDGFGGWAFKHHMGHGVGLSPHEAPHLNPDWDDTLQVGDVIAVEPGLYGDELRTGIRVEDMYYVGETGLQRLSSADRGL